MTLFVRLLYAPDPATGICRACTWGTVRKGFRSAEAEVFCRLVGPSARVRYAMRECSSFCDRRAPAASAEARRDDFVTEIMLSDEEEVRGTPADGSKE